MEHNSQFSQLLKSAFPTPSREYSCRIDEVVAHLRKSDGKRANHVKTSLSFARIAVAACAAILLLSVCTFAIKPALAAELPFLGNAVYTLSPTVSLDGDKLNVLSELIKTAATAFAMGDYAAVSAMFYQGDGWYEDENTLLAAKYLHYILYSTEALPNNDSSAEATLISVIDESGRQRAFSYELTISLELNGKGGNSQQEQLYAKLVETSHGLYITSVQIESDGYTKYIAERNFLDLNDLHYENLADSITFETDYIIYMTLHKSAAVSAEEKLHLLENLQTELINAKADKQSLQFLMRSLENEKAYLQEQSTPVTSTVKELATEVMYRYYLSRKLCEMQDFSDIMERNEATDLFFYDVQLSVDKTISGSLSAIDTVKRGTSKILEITLDKDNHFTGRFYVKTEITSGGSRGVGEEIILSFEKQSDNWMVVGYDRTVGDGIYTTRLKPLAEQYKQQGLPWADANKKAYEELADTVIP